MMQRTADSMGRSATKNSSSPIKSLAGQMAQKAQKKQTQNGRRYLAIDEQVAERTSKLSGYPRWTEGMSSRYNAAPMRRNRRVYDNKGYAYGGDMYPNP
jgi:hypothetical protein